MPALLVLAAVAGAAPLAARAGERVADAAETTPSAAAAPAATPAASPAGVVSLLDLLGADGPLQRAPWPTERVMTQTVGLDTASAPGFVKVEIPSGGAVLEGAYGVKPERWGDVQSGPFRFAVVVLTPRESEGRGRREIVFEQRIDPARNAGERRWLPLRVDLDRYAGGEVLLAFLIDTPKLVEPPGDLAGWLEPRLVPRAAGQAARTSDARTSPDGTRRKADTPTR